MNIERLIENVRRHVCLYDLSHKQYKNAIFKADIWESIGRELNQSSQSCKTRWKTLRDGYTKYKKLTKRMARIGKKNYEYIWSSQLTFLDNYNMPKPTESYVTSAGSQSQSSLSSLVAEINSSGDSLPHAIDVSLVSSPDFSPPQLLPQPSQLQLSLPTLSPKQVRPTRRTKRTHTEGEIDKAVNYSRGKRTQLDRIDYLFLSYAETFKKIAPTEQAILKLEMAKLFTAAELRMFRNSNDNQQQIVPVFPSQYANVSSVDDATLQMNRQLNTQESINLNYSNSFHNSNDSQQESTDCEDVKPMFT